MADREEQAQLLARAGDISTITSNESVTLLGLGLILVHGGTLNEKQEGRVRQIIDSHAAGVRALEPTEQEIVRLALKHNLGSDTFDRARLLAFAQELRALGVPVRDGQVDRKADPDEGAAS